MIGISIWVGSINSGVGSGASIAFFFQIIGKRIVLLRWVIIDYMKIEKSTI